MGTNTLIFIKMQVKNVCRYQLVNKTISNCLDCGYVLKIIIENHYRIPYRVSINLYKHNDFFS